MNRALGYYQLPVTVYRTLGVTHTCRLDVSTRPPNSGAAERNPFFIWGHAVLVPHAQLVVTSVAIKLHMPHHLVVALCRLLICQRNLNPKITKARFGRLLRPLAWKQRGPILVPVLHNFGSTYLLRHLPTYLSGPTRGRKGTMNPICHIVSCNEKRCLCQYCRSMPKHNSHRKMLRWKPGLVQP